MPPNRISRPSLPAGARRGGEILPATPAARDGEPACPNMSAISSADELILPARASVARQTAVAEPLSDHSLLEAARTGDEAAFAELVRRYRNQITNYVYRLTNDYESAVDLAQETFLRVFRAADRYQATYAFSTYIYRIATNLAISELR